MGNSKKTRNLTLAEKYKLKGAQQLTYDEYQVLKAKNSKPKFRLPPIVKFILGTPFIIVFCVGVFFIPWMLYQIATSPSAPPPTDDLKTANAATR